NGSSENRRKIAEYAQLREDRIAAVRGRLNTSKGDLLDEIRSSILSKNLLELIGEMLVLFNEGHISRRTLCFCFISQEMTFMSGIFESKSFAEALQKEEVTAEEALDAYIWKALQLHEKFNCAAEFLIEAFDEAKKLDDVWHGKTNKPPLFGIPFSVKSNFNVKGYDCSLSLAKFLGKPVSSDCSFIVHLRSLGAIPFVTTNVPQALLSYVCSSAVYGTTANPYDPGRTPGGSSGGECVLCAAGGTVFGIGTDLAGSLRIPAAMCGLVTLKPTESRFVIRESFTGLPGRGRMGFSCGYFTRTVKEQKLLLKYTYGNENYIKEIPQMVPLPLNEKQIGIVKGRKLRIGYYIDDGFLVPIPACSRAVSETIEALENMGHETVLFEIPNMDRASALFFKNIMPDRGAFCNYLFSNEPLSPFIRLFALMLKVPVCIRWFAGWILKMISPQMSTVCSSYVKDLSDLRRTQEMTDDFRAEVLTAFHFLIAFSFLVPAVPHKYPSRMTFCAFATGLYNMLDFPSAVVPTGFWPVAANKSAGLPLAVQIVALPFHEEDCLAVMEIVEELWEKRNLARKGSFSKLNLAQFLRYFPCEKMNEKKY
ncbi:unnamed protein product, partial [Enterobius vermicularis]|uniref:Amidase domain-containing protein n=1 Tax=Enterobius vermicularis TaxID=51028 RepID=A0A0N4UZM4_ENTVE